MSEPGVTTGVEVDEHGQCHDCGLTWHDGRALCHHVVRWEDAPEVVTLPLEVE